MKKINGLALLILAVAVTVTGCKKLISSIFPGIDVDAPAITVQIPATLPFPGAPVPTDEVPVGTFSQSFNFDSTIKAKTSGNFSAADVTSVQLKQIAFNLNNADQQNNLANFKSVRFTLSSNTNSSVADLGTINFPDSTASSYTYIPVNTPDLRPYLNGSQLTYSVYGRLRRYTTVPMQMTVIVTLKAK